MRRLGLVTRLLLLAACDDAAPPAPLSSPLPVDGASDASVDAAAPDASLEADELPCEVSQVLAARCAPCHADPPTSGATLPLLGRRDFLAAHGAGRVADDALARLEGRAEPMPPSSEPALSAQELATLTAWLQAGSPVGACAPLPERPVPVTCTSGDLTTETGVGSLDMNPGMSCRGCHLLIAPERADYFSGTVFADYHEQDLCNSPPPPDAKIEILDAQGIVRRVIAPSRVGNFTAGSAGPGLSLPYTARLVAHGQVRAMRTPQTSGDCNACHTAQGEQGAPGRLVWPRP